jgi:hypothetical protein
MRVSELGELTGAHWTPRVVRPMKGIEAFDVNLTEHVLGRPLRSGGYS